MLNPMLRWSAGALVLSAALLAGCSSQSTQTPAATTPNATGTEQVTGVQVVDPADFQQAIDSGAELIDVRTSIEFSAGHIEGAVNMDIANPEFEAQIAILDPTREYAVYCRSGNRSGVAAAQMSDAGLSSIVDLGGGILVWEDRGYPVV